jgi:hypothetical protein
MKEHTMQYTVLFIITSSPLGSVFVKRLIRVWSVCG